MKEIKQTFLEGESPTLKVSYLWFWENLFLGTARVYLKSPFVFIFVSDIAQAVRPTLLLHAENSCIL